MTQPPSSKLQVFYDGACPLCSREVRHLQARDRQHRIEWIDIATPAFDARAYGLYPMRVHEVMHASTPDGRIYTDVAAFQKIWAEIPSPITTPLVYALKIPGAKPIARVAYKLFARNRYRLSGRCTPESCPTPPA